MRRLRLQLSLWWQEVTPWLLLVGNEAALLALAIFVLFVILVLISLL
jgi:fumarate reductase subunit C